MKRSLLALLALMVLSPMLLPSQAQAEPKGWVFQDDDTHGFELAVLGSYLAPITLGGQVYVGIPVAKNGFTSKINDAFFVDIGAFFGGVPNPLFIGNFWTMPYGGVRYQIWLFDWFSIFWAVRGGPLIEVTTPTVSPYVGGSFGMDFFASEKVALRVELGWPTGVGARFAF